MCESRLGKSKLLIDGNVMLPVGVVAPIFGLCSGVLNGVSLRWNIGGEFGLDFLEI